MPFPGLTEVRIQWVAIQQGNYKLYGFLIYTGADNIIVEFLKEGILDLDVLSGKDCAIFLIEPPSKKWINYVRKNDHPWGQFFDDLINPTAEHKAAQREEKSFRMPGAITIEGIYNSVVVLGDDNFVSMTQLLEPNYDVLFDRSEAYKVAQHFGISNKEIPCLVFFKDIEDQNIWIQSLEKYDTHNALKFFFRDFFDSEHFKSLFV